MFDKILETDIKNVAKFLSGILAVGLMLWSCVLTTDFMLQIFPGNYLAVAASLFLFCFGTLIWLGKFIYLAEGSVQRLLTISMVVVDLLGEFLIVLADLFLGGQTLVEIPESLPIIALAFLGISSLLNFSALCAYIIFSPDAWLQMRIKYSQDTITKAALDCLDTKVSVIADEVGEELAEGMARYVLDDLENRYKKRYNVQLTDLTSKTNSIVEDAISTQLAEPPLNGKVTKSLKV